MNEQVIIEYLKNIQQDVRDIANTQASQGEEITKLREFRADVKGSVRTASAVTLTISSIIAWIINHIRP